jgi:outer membrane protein OmpA-like peptidoglycan-associated protein
MKRDTRLQEKPVDEVREVAFQLNPRGYLREIDRDYPLRRGFPRVPAESVSPGESWNAEGEERYVRASGEVVRSSFNCLYTYRGEDVYQQRPVRIIDFSYVFGPRMGSGRSGGRMQVGGKSEGSVIIFTDEGGGYFIRERIERRVADGSGGGSVVERQVGFRLTWSTGISPAHLDAVEQRMVQALGGDDTGKAASVGNGGGDGRDGGSSGGGNGSSSGEGLEQRETGSGPPAQEAEGEDQDEVVERDITVERREEGIVLNVPDIHFRPDEATILPDERNRLDRLAKLLEMAGDATFLVKGHTADVGSKESQLSLSVERAKTIIEELARRGLSKDRFLYRGVGGEEPVASNATEAGRARNRRVEVIVLD